MQSVHQTLSLLLLLLRGRTPHTLHLLHKGSSHKSTGPGRACALWAFHRHHSLPQAFTCCGVGAPRGVQVGRHSPLLPHGHSCLTMSAPWALGESAPVPGAPPPSPPLTMVSAELLPSHVLSFFCCSCTATFFPFLNMLSIASIGHRGNFLEASHRSDLCRAPSSPCYQNLAVQTKHMINQS